MNSNKLFYTLTIAIALIVISVLSACKKDDTSEQDNSFEKYRQASQDYSEAERTGTDIDNIGDEAAMGHYGPNGPGGPFGPNGVLNPCATVTHDTTITPHVITVDFGPVNCLGNDGHYRRGQIIITYSGGYWSTGAVKTTSFNGYFVDNKAITGTRTITNNGTNANGNYNWSIDVVNFTITKPNGDYHTRNSARLRTIIAGYSTPTPWDDVYSISGSSSQSNSNGNSSTAIITNDLRKEIACHWMVSGTVDITPANLPTRTFDYGNGACDNQATITVNGVTYNITLP